MLFNNIIIDTLHLMSIPKWCGLLVVELIIIASIYLITKERTPTLNVVYGVIVGSCYLYIAFIAFTVEFAIGSILFYLLLTLSVILLLTTIIYYLKQPTYSILVESKKGFYSQEKTDDYKYTFKILDEHKFTVAESCLKYENVFIFNELVRQTRNAIKVALIEDQTQKYTLKQDYPKIVLFKENDLYYFDLYINQQTITIESKGYETYKKALKAILRMQDYGKTSVVLIGRELVNGEKLADFVEVVEPTTSLVKEVVKTKKEVKVVNKTNANVFDLFDNPTNEVVKEEVKDEPKVAEIVTEEPKEQPKVVETITKEEPKVVETIAKEEPKETIVEEIKVEETKEEVKPVEVIPTKKVVKVNEPKHRKPQPVVALNDKQDSLSKSFEAKLYLNTEDNKQYYSDVKNIILSYKGVYSKVSFKHETFKYDGKLIMKMQIRGSKVAILCPFTEEEYSNSKFKFIDVDNFDAHEETPLLYKVYNPLRLKYATEIIQGVMEKYDIKQLDHPEVIDYATQYHGKDVEQLLLEGEIRRQ